MTRNEYEKPKLTKIGKFVRVIGMPFEKLFKGFVAALRFFGTKPSDLEE